MSVFPQSFTQEDSLLGSNTSYRAWWNVTHYQISIKPNYLTKTIAGYNTITYKVISDTLPCVMQIDLQEPLLVDSIILDERKVLQFEKQKNRWLLSLNAQQKNSQHAITLYYHGKPKEAINPPWEGGFVWKKDSLSNPWMSVACQGIGASVWMPCKDLQSDEPEQGAILSMIVPDTLMAIGNGKNIAKHKMADGYMTYTWQVKNSINVYNIIPYIGKYIAIKDSIKGEGGILHTDYWILDYHLNQAKQHLKPSVIKTLNCLEHWFGSYPFYEDSYKIVEAPYLGMEHQSNIAYGNSYMNGYAGTDLYKTKWGLKWDFIVVHETAHEWFGNSITARDMADNWIHEGLASYAEVLFTECEFGKEAGNDYCERMRTAIRNDMPLIGTYNVKKEGSGDMYSKGSNIIHLIRHVIDNDESFRVLLRAVTEHFNQKVITTKEFEDYLILQSGKDLQPLFDQYLRTTKIPYLEYTLKSGQLSFRYSNCINTFNIPIKIKTNQEFWIYPTTQWQTIPVDKNTKAISVNRNVYVLLKKQSKKSK